MKILIIGGTYFAGRSFTKLLLKRGDEIFLLNRGNVPISSPGIVSVKSDRRDYDNIKTRIGELKENGGIPDHMDAVVDFCGYQKGDIEGLISVLSLSGISFDRYILSVHVMYSCMAPVRYMMRTVPKRTGSSRAMWDSM